MARKCVNLVDSFCYICGEIKFSSQKRTMIPLVKTAYQHYFSMKVGDQEVCGLFFGYTMRMVEKEKKIFGFCCSYGMGEA